MVVAEASVLVSELPRKRGRELLLHPDLRVVAESKGWRSRQGVTAMRLRFFPPPRQYRSERPTPTRAQLASPAGVVPR
jgi:hypothetical protein